MKTFLAVITFLTSVYASADFKAFTQADFEAAQKAGQTVVVDFYADWCPTCKKQQPILNEIVNMQGYKNVVALKADFDSEKDLKKRLKVKKQSTIVVFKGSKEVARSIGVTSKEDLQKLIDQGM